MRTFKSLQHGLPGSRHQKWYFLLFAALTVLYSSCRKPEIEEQQPQILSKKSALVRKDMKISMDEIMAKLPVTVIYSLGNQFHMYTEKAQWRNAKDGLLVRIPINERQTKYIYALKPYGKPEQTNVYIVQYIPEAGNRPGSFNGKMLWLDMQNMSTYGLQYRNGTIVSRKNASVIAAPTWEAAAIEYGYFRLNKDNTISIRQGEVKPPPAEIIMAKFTANPKGNDPHSLEQWLIDLWWWFRDKFGYKNDAPFTENGPIGGNGGWTGPSGGINYGPVGGDGGPNPGDYGGGGGGWSDAGYSDPNNGNNNGPLLPGNAGENAAALYLINSILNITSNQQSWLLGHPETVSRIQDFLLNPINNLTLEQKKEAVREHIRRLVSDPTYNAFVSNYEQQGNTGMWWVNETWLYDFGGIDYGKWAINYLKENPSKSINDFFYDKNDFYDQQGEIDDYQDGNYDNNTYPSYAPNTPWPNITPVIPVSKFIGWGTHGVRMNCMSYAIEQIKQVGYRISGYFASGQTFQVYTAQNGVNNNQLIQGLSYIRYALSSGIPVIVGVDNHPGSSNPQTDNTTDHFIVIVGMGTNTTGKYLRFYDNASGVTSLGTNNLNLLYYNPTTGLISGASQTGYGQNKTYKLTMIRKSKPL